MRRLEQWPVPVCFIGFTLDHLPAFALYCTGLAIGASVSVQPQNRIPVDLQPRLHLSQQLFVSRHLQPVMIIQAIGSLNIDDKNAAIELYYPVERTGKA